MLDVLTTSLVGRESKHFPGPGWHVNLVCTCLCMCVCVCVCVSDVNNVSVYT